MTLKKRLTSRKFWLAVASFITFMASGNTVEALSVVMAYLGVQGYVDSKY